MMFQFDLAFVVSLIALGLGVTFLIWAFRNEGVGVTLAKVIGYIIAILAILVLLCTSYYGLKYWEDGYFGSPIAPQLILKKHMMMQRCNKMMQMQPMLSGRMGMMPKQMQGDKHTMQQMPVHQQHQRMPKGDMTKMPPMPPKPKMKP